MGVFFQFGINKYVDHPRAQTRERGVRVPTIGGLGGGGSHVVGGVEYWWSPAGVDVGLAVSGESRGNEIQWRHRWSFPSHSALPSGSD